MKTEETLDARISGQERILEIIVFLLAEIRLNRELTDIDLQPLSERGFTPGEISSAFSWLYDRASLSASEVQLNASFLQYRTPNQPYFRVYHEVEKTALSLEAQGYLLQMRALGVIQDADL